MVLAYPYPCSLFTTKSVIEHKFRARRWLVYKAFVVLLSDPSQVHHWHVRISHRLSWKGGQGTSVMKGTGALLQRVYENRKLVEVSPALDTSLPWVVGALAMGLLHAPAIQAIYGVWHVCLEICNLGDKSRWQGLSLWEEELEHCKAVTTCLWNIGQSSG